MVLPAYFQRRLGLATTVFLAGVSCGQLLMPVLTEALQKRYDHDGAVLIHGAVLLNCVVACALFRPLQNRRGAATLCSVARPKVDNTTNGGSPLIESNLQHCVENKESSIDKFINILKEIGLNVVNNIKELGDCRMQVICMSMALLLMGYINFVGLIPFALVAAGHNSKDASMAVAVTGLGTIFVRIIMSFVIDRTGPNRKILFICGVIFSSICSYGTLLYYFLIKHMYTYILSLLKMTYMYTSVCSKN